jgi:hypothetical protein
VGGALAGLGSPRQHEYARQHGSSGRPGKTKAASLSMIGAYKNKH